MLVKKGRHSEISMNYKLKILAKIVNLIEKFGLTEKAVSATAYW